MIAATVMDRPGAVEFSHDTHPAGADRPPVGVLRMACQDGTGSATVFVHDPDILLRLAAEAMDLRGKLMDELGVPPDPEPFDCASCGRLTDTPLCDACARP